MGILRGEANRLHRLIEDLLTLSRLERGAAALDLEPQVLDALIAPVTASQVARAHLKQIDLRHEPNPNVPLVSVALGPMVQVLTNLIGNAVNYAPAGAVVTVSTRIDEARGGRYAAIRVHNTQPAIPEEDLPHLFERFYRGHAALSPARRAPAWAWRSAGRSSNGTTAGSTSKAALTQGRPSRFGWHWPTRSAQEPWDESAGEHHAVAVSRLAVLQGLLRQTHTGHTWVG